MRGAIAQRLVTLRGARSRKEVAHAVQLSESAIQMYENGERVPRDGTKVKLARYYGVSVEELFFAPNDHESCSDHNTG